MCLLLFTWHYITDSISANGSNQLLMVADAWEWTRDVQFWHISTNATAVLFLGCFYLQGLNYTTETFSPEINLCSLDSLGPAPFACLFHGATLGHQVQEWHKMVAFGASCVCTIRALLCTCVYNMPFDVSLTVCIYWNFKHNCNQMCRTMYAVLYLSCQHCCSSRLRLSYTQQYRPYVNHVKLLPGLSFLYRKSLLSFYH